LLEFELAAQFGLPALKPLQLVALGAGEEPPKQAEDQQANEDAEADLELAGPGADVVEIELPEILQRHFLLAHRAPPSAAPPACPAGCGCASGSCTCSGCACPSAAAGASAAGSVAAPCPSAGAGPLLTGGTGSGTPSPSSSFGAFGFDSCT